VAAPFLRSLATAFGEDACLGVLRAAAPARLHEMGAVVAETARRLSAVLGFKPGEPGM
jgi:hypothetical protein